MSIQESNVVMPPLIEGIYKSMLRHLEEVESEESRIITMSKKRIAIVKQAMQTLKEYVAQHGFISSEEEIYFFKQIKPTFHSQLIYFTLVLDFETKRPLGAKDIQKEFIKKWMEKIHSFFIEEEPFYVYYNSESTYMDHYYFQRGKKDIETNMNYLSVDADPVFSTSHDSLISEFIAYESFGGYLDEELTLLTDQSSVSPLADNELKWTGPQIILKELIYALFFSKMLNDGKAQLKQIAEAFQKMFNVSLGNFYRSLQDLRIRKKGEASGLDLLKNSLLDNI